MASSIVNAVGPSHPDVTSYDKLKDLKLIGKGGFGSVYQARHKDWGPVAYKELEITFISATDRVANELKNEVSVHIKLRHPNIITLMAMVFEPSHYGVILEFASHGDIFTFLQTFPVEWPWKLQLAYDIALGMNYLHTQPKRAVIHGDLKVKNVLVSDGFKAKISDFGLARWKQYSCEVTHRGSQGGTITHIPPENWMNINIRRSEKYDVYGYGILFWELLAFPSRPFEKDDIKVIKQAVIQGHRPPTVNIPSDVPDFMIAVVEDCWAQDPQKRPMFAEVKNKLDVYVQEKQTEIRTAYVNLQTHEHKRISRHAHVGMPSSVRTRTVPPDEVSNETSYAVGGNGILVPQESIRTNPRGPCQAFDNTGSLASIFQRQRLTDRTHPGLQAMDNTRSMRPVDFNIGQSVVTNPGPVEALDASIVLHPVPSYGSEGHSGLESMDTGNETLTEENNSSHQQHSVTSNIAGAHGGPSHSVELVDVDDHSARPSHLASPGIQSAVFSPTFSNLPTNMELE